MTTAEKILNDCSGDRDLQVYALSNALNVTEKERDAMASAAKEVENLEARYPNWKGKFDTLDHAIAWHTISQDLVIGGIRANYDAQKKMLVEIAGLLEGALPTLRAHVGYHTDRDYVLRVVSALERCAALQPNNKEKAP